MTVAGDILQGRKGGDLQPSRVKGLGCCWGPEGSDQPTCLCTAVRGGEIALAMHEWGRD